MRLEARKALSTIQTCLATNRFRALPHFLEQMDKRALFWPDVSAVIDAPDDVRYDGLDRFGRDKWIVSGTAADGLPIEIVCVLDVDDSGNVTVFITIY